MRLIKPRPPQKRFEVTINASGWWGTKNDAAIPGGAIQLQFEASFPATAVALISPDAAKPRYNPRIDVSVSTVVVAETPGAAVYDGIYKISHWENFYEDWLDDAENYSINVECVQNL